MKLPASLTSSRSPGGVQGVRRKGRGAVRGQSRHPSAGILSLPCKLCHSFLSRKITSWQKPLGSFGSQGQDQCPHPCAVTLGGAGGHAVCPEPEASRDPKEDSGLGSFPWRPDRPRGAEPPNVRIWEHNWPFGRFDINDLETISGLFRGRSLHLHLKTPEELVVLAGGRECWPGAINGKLFCLMLPGPKKCELCRFLAPFMVRIAGSVVGAWLLCSQLLAALLEAGLPSLPKQSGVL